MNESCLRNAERLLRDHKIPVLAAETDLILGLFGHVPKGMYFPFRPLERFDEMLQLFRAAFPDLHMNLEFEGVIRCYLYQQTGLTIGSRRHEWIAHADTDTAFPTIAIALAMINAKLRPRDTG